MSSHDFDDAQEAQTMAIPRLFLRRQPSKNSGGKKDVLTIT